MVRHIRIVFTLSKGSAQRLEGPDVAEHTTDTTRCIQFLNELFLSYLFVWKVLGLREREVILPCILLLSYALSVAHPFDLVDRV